MVAAAVLPLVGLTHVPDRDVDALLAAASHHSKPQFERVIEARGDDHCLACHLLRALSDPHAGGASALLPPPRLICAWQGQTAVERRSVDYASPPRAPPVSGSASHWLRSAVVS
jgi:hypothetical protein